MKAFMSNWLKIAWQKYVTCPNDFLKNFKELLCQTLSWEENSAVAKNREILTFFGIKFRGWASLIDFEGIKFRG